MGFVSRIIAVAAAFAFTVAVPHAIHAQGLPAPELSIGPDQNQAAHCSVVICEIAWGSGAVASGDVEVVASMTAGTEVLEIDSPVPYTIENGSIVFHVGDLARNERGVAHVHFRVLDSAEAGSQIVSTASFTDDLGRSASASTSLGVTDGNPGPFLSVGPDQQFGKQCEVVVCVIDWQNTCAAATGVRVLARTIPGVELIDVESDIEYTITDQGILFDVGDLAENERGGVRVRFRVPGDTPEGTIVESGAAYGDDAGRSVSATTSFLVNGEPRSCPSDPAVPGEPRVSIGPDQVSARAGDRVTCLLSWSSPGFATDGVTLRAIMQGPAEVVDIQASTPFVADANGITFMQGPLGANQTGRARVRFRVGADAPIGASIVSAIGYTDSFGREASGVSSLLVRGSNAADQALIKLNTKATKKLRNGGTLNVQMSYLNAFGSGTATLDLPPQVSVVTAVPTPTSVDGNVLTWSGLPGGGGPFDPINVSGTVLLANNETVGTLSVVSSISDERGLSVQNTRFVTVTPASGSNSGPLSGTLSLSGVSKGGFRPGTINSAIVTWRALTGTGTLTMVLPEGLEPVLIAPDGGVRDGNTITWSGLTKGSSSARVDSLISQTAVPGSVLTVNGSITNGTSTAAVDVSVPIRD